MQTSNMNDVIDGEDQTVTIDTPYHQVNKFWFHANLSEDNEQNMKYEWKEKSRNTESEEYVSNTCSSEYIMRIEPNSGIKKVSLNRNGKPFFALSKLYE